MKVIGVTGSIGCGKSVVCSFLEKKGAVVIDADKVSRELSRPGKKLWVLLKDTYGDGIFNADKTLNRKALADIVFKDKGSLEHLCELTHPVIIGRIAEKIEQIRKDDKAVHIVLEAPLLIEADMLDMVDVVFVVKATQAQQIKRLAAERCMAEDEVAARIHAQLPQEEKLKHADYIIDNTGSLKDTQHQLSDIWKKITE